MAHDIFKRRPGEVSGTFPAKDALQQVLGMRMMRACWDPFPPSAPGKRVTLGEMLRSQEPMARQLATLWHADIAPSFHDAAQLAVVTVEGIHCPSFHRLAMVVGGHPDASAMVDLKDFAPPQFPSPPAFPTPAEPSRLDGCRYGVTFHNNSSTVRVDFADVTPVWAAWSATLFQVATRLQQETGNTVLAAYLEMWRGYLAL